MTLQIIMFTMLCLAFLYIFSLISRVEYLEKRIGKLNKSLGDTIDLFNRHAESTDESINNILDAMFKLVRKLQ